MSELLADIAWRLAWSSLWLSLAAGCGWLLIRLTHVRKAGVHQAVWLLVLAAGWTWWTLPVSWTVSEEWGFLASKAPVRAGGPYVILLDKKRVTTPNPIPPRAVMPYPERQAVAVRSNALGLTLFFVWIAGLATIIARDSRALWRFQRLLRQAAPIAGDDATRWDALVASAWPRREIPLLSLPGVGPLVAWRPGGSALVVDRETWDTLGQEERRLVMVHELAHVRRHDLARLFLSRVLCWPQWFNPLAWFARRRFEESLEWGADEAAWRDETEAAAFARILLALCSRPSRVSAGLGAASSATGRRIRRLLDGIPSEARWKRIFVTAAVAALALAGIVDVNLVADSPATTAAPLVPVLTASYAPAKTTSKQAERTVEAAAKAFAIYEERFRADRTTIESVYLWSRRWMEAEISAATARQGEIDAARRHRDRMKKLVNREAALDTLNARNDVAAARYYLEEAESLLLDVENGAVTYEGASQTYRYYIPPDGTAPLAPQPNPSPEKRPWKSAKELFQLIETDGAPGQTH